MQIKMIFNLLSILILSTMWLNAGVPDEEKKTKEKPKEWHDKKGRLIKLTTKNTVTEIVYWENSKIKQKNFEILIGKNSGLTQTFYNKKGKPIKIETKDAITEITYDKNGNATYSKTPKKKE